VLDVIEEEQLLARSQRLGQAVVARLQQLATALPAIAEVRGVGLLVGIELCNIGNRDAADLAEAVLYRCLSEGLSFKVGQGNVLVLAPPLNVKEDDLWWAIDQIAIALHAECAA
jgi:4-aminobutyrate aminotransferase